MSVTAGQLIAAMQGLSQLGVDTSKAANLNLADLSADAVVGEDVLGVVAIFWPPATLLIAALEIAVELAPLIHVQPDASPLADAQTSEGRGGRRG